jgi:ParB family chromosome partitioning protein
VNKERRLGRGLAALLGEDAEPVSLSQFAEGRAVSTQTVAPRAEHVIDEEHRELDDDRDIESSHDDSPSADDTDHYAAAQPSSTPHGSSHEADRPNDQGVSLGQPATRQPAPPRSEAATAKDGDLLLLSVYEIDDNPFQPRREFSESEIASLAESLKEHDMLQPVLVRRIGHRWQLISGERRLRAAIKAGWSQVPARVRQADDRLVAELAIVENLQRKDLNAIEKALSFRRYIDQHQCTQDELGQRLKIDRSTIANLMRLLELPQPVQEQIQRGEISMGHARALLPLGDESLQREYSERIQREGISVREIERLVQERILEEDGELLGRGAKRSGKKQKKPNRSSHVASLEQELRILLGTKVDIRQTARGKGQMVVHFRNNEEFERIKALITEPAQSQLARYAG